MKKYILLGLLLNVFYVVKAQIAIGAKDTPTDKSQILDIKSEQGQKGVLFPTVDAVDFLPNKVGETSEGETIYEEDYNLTGGIIYNKEVSLYNKFNGKYWNPANQLGVEVNPSLSRLKSPSSESVTCVSISLIQICSPGKTFKIQGLNILESHLVDNLEIADPSGESREVVIKKSGLYNVSGSVGVNGQSISAELSATIGTIIAIDAMFPNSSDWVTLVSKEMESHTTIADFEGRKNVGLSRILYLPAGAKLRMYFNMDIPNSLISIGASSYKSDTDHKRTFLSVYLLKEY